VPVEWVLLGEGHLRTCELEDSPQLSPAPAEQGYLHIQNQLLFFFPLSNMGTYKTMGVSHYGLAIYIKKYVKAKEELWKLKYISPCKNIIFKTIL
jgi:hypothetical protein